MKKNNKYEKEFGKDRDWSRRTMFIKAMLEGMRLYDEGSYAEAYALIKDAVLGDSERGERDER